jgi:hypothetical protein
MEIYNYNNGLQAGNRRPHLWFAKGNEVLAFTGSNEAGWYAISSEQYTKNGKWSFTDYKLLLCEGVRAIELLSPLHKTWGDDCNSWEEVRARLKVSLENARKILQQSYPDQAKRLDDLEAFVKEAQASKPPVPQNYELVNLTPHKIVILSGEEKIIVEPSGIVARVATTSGAALTGFFWAGTTFGEVEGIPAPEAGKVYIVSAIVASRIGASRSDIFYPGTGPNDGAIRENGNIVAVTRLIRSY